MSDDHSLAERVARLERLMAAQLTPEDVAAAIAPPVKRFVVAAAVEPMRRLAARVTALEERAAADRT